MNAADDPAAHELTNRERIWHVVAQIPKGKVATYGQIAELAGLPRRARLVGTTLKRLPKGSKLPWHRVINSQGKSSFPVGSDGHKRQCDRLEKEDVVLRGQSTLRHHRWEP